MHSRNLWSRVNENINRLFSPLGMAGLTGIGSGCLELYIYVNPEQHGKGYGKKIMEILEHQASAYGAMWLTLETKEDNKIACGLYERRGFSIYQKDSIAKGKIAFRKELLS